MSLGILTKLSSIGTKLVTKLPAPVSGAIGKASLAATVNSPWIFAMGGGVLAIGAVIETARKTPKFMEDLEEYAAMLDKHKENYQKKLEYDELVAKGEAPALDKEYTKKDYYADRASIYAKIVVAGIKRYGKGSCNGCICIGCD